MPRFRKKPVEVEAVQWFPDLEHEGVHRGGSNRNIPEFYVITIHGKRASLSPGDWILPEPQEGMFYPVNPEVFKNTYDPI